MKEDNIDIKNAIPIFNFDFSTNMLFRCSQTNYAKSFIEGEIHFSQPQIWIEQGENGNNTQGDKLEGVFLASSKNDNSDFINSLNLNGEIECIEDEKLFYFRKKDIKQCYALCFYGLRSDSFNEKIIDENGIAHYYSRVSREYFKGFSKIKDREEYEKASEIEKSSVVFIHNPNLFFSKIQDKLINDFGISQDEIIISPVEYINKKQEHISMVPYPMELLIKDKDYEKQSEIRIIINTDNSKFINYMKKNNGNINIGSIESICDLYDYYFKDLIIENPQKNEFIFNLPSPKIESVKEISLNRMLSALYKLRKDNGEKWVENGNKNELIRYIEKTILDKYGINVEYDKNGKIIIKNANENIINIIRNENPQKTAERQFNDKINKLINEKRYNIAVLEMKKEINNVTYEDSINFYIAKIYEEIKEYNKAIELYSNCISNKMRTADSFSSRSNCYTMIGMYSKAIDDLNSLQEIIGYNYQIYSNIGFNLIQLGEIEKAISFFNKSIELNQINPYAYYTRGVAYYKLKNYKMFEDDVKKAIEYEPDNKAYRDTYEKFRKQ